MNLNRIFDALVASGMTGQLAGGIAGTPAGPGGAAIVGGLAWQAYERYRAARPDAAATTADDGAWRDLSRHAFLPPSAAPAARRDLLVLRAMITAACADGHVDTDERVRIYRRIEALDISHAEKGLLLEEISQPLALYQLVQQVPSRAFAAEVYLAAALVADTPSPEHQVFLQDLAEQLALPPDLVLALRRQASAALPPLPEETGKDRSSGLKPLPPATMLSPQA